MNENYDGTPIRFENAVAPFVLAIDIGSGSTRCSLYDSLARPIKKYTTKVDHLFTESADGTVEINADQVVSEVEQVITSVTRKLDRRAIAAVVMDTFASSLVVTDSEGRALTPCLTYADSRCAPQLEQLRARLDEDEVHQMTGTRLHTSYHAPRLLWLHENHADVMAQAACFCSLGEYVYLKLAGVRGGATSTMAWAGILNRTTGDLEPSLLETSGVSPDQFAPILDPDDPIYDVDPQVAQRWPALEGAAWFPAIPDGYASNLGVGATDTRTVAMSAATSGAMRTIVTGVPDYLPSGLWAYRVSRSESIVGGALNDVGRVTLWLENTLAHLEVDDVNALLRLAPTSGTPLVLPFLTGERSTGWAGRARGVITGLSSTSGAPELWRGSMEGVALSYARVFAQLTQVNPQVEKVIASGGVSQRYPGLMDVTAQAVGSPVQIVDAKRVTMRGAAVLALSVLRPGQPVASLPLQASIPTDPEQREYYEGRLAEFEKVYHQVIG